MSELRLRTTPEDTQVVLSALLREPASQLMYLVRREFPDREAASTLDLFVDAKDVIKDVLDTQLKPERDRPGDLAKDVPPVLVDRLSPHFSQLFVLRVETPPDGTFARYVRL